MSRDITRPRWQGILNFMKGRSSLYVTTTPKFGNCSHCGVGDIAHLLCLVTLHENMIKGFYDFMEGRSSLYVTTVPALSPYAFWYWRYNFLNSSRDLTRPRVNRVMQLCKNAWLNGLVTLWKETPHCMASPCQYSSHRHCSSEYIKILVFQMILQDHLTIWSCDLLKVVKLSGHHAIFCGHRYCSNGDVIVLVGHVIL